MGGFIRVLSSIGLPEFVKIFFRNLFQNIWVWLAFLLPWIVQKIVVLLGMGVVTYTGAGILVDTLKVFVLEQYESLPANMFKILVMMGVDEAINMIAAGRCSDSNRKSLSAAIFQKRSA